MSRVLFDVLDRTMKKYGEGNYYDNLIRAKKEYFLLTGNVNDDDSDYESRMNSFNDWYLLQYIHLGKNKPLVNEISTTTEHENNILSSLKSFNHSLFEYYGETMSGVKVIKDLLHDKKITLSKDNIIPAILKKEIFTGRTVDIENESYMLKGFCILPKEVKLLLLKHVKKVKSFNDPKLELSFLLRIEYLKTKWARYGHIEPEKIFIFNY